MPTPDQSRIETEAARPLAARLWQALQPLRSVTSFMQTGAHPDDETSAMLATLGLRDGMALAYACSTRGEGGQNDIGTEAGAEIGTLRTAEMERAADVLDMRLYWFGEGPADPIHDFGFSKSGEETIDRWGRDRTLARFVEIVRTERPDILCPTFLNIPGQHGHHRAMTLAAQEVMALAADPAFGGNDLPPWEVSKLYLPAWSGAGGAYDDEEPPPLATVEVDASGSDPVLGFGYLRIGQQSRAFHRTQGMGRWVPSGTSQTFPLHLLETRVGSDSGHPSDNLPRRLSDIDSALAPADAAIDRAIAAFPDRAAILSAAAEALSVIRQATVPGEDHRLARKIDQLARVMRLCALPDASARTERTFLAPGDTVPLHVEARDPDHGETRTDLSLPDGVTATEDALIVASDAAQSPVPMDYDPLRPAAPALLVHVAAHGAEATSAVAFDNPPLILPAPRATLSRQRAILNTTLPGRSLSLSITDTGGGTPAFDLPDCWRQDWQGRDVTITAPDDLSEALQTFPLLLDGAPASTVRRIEHPHVASRFLATPAELDVRTAAIAAPRGRIGYIGAGNDRAGDWLAAIGADVTQLSDADLAGTTPFAGYDTILIGVFAFRFRPGLINLAPILHEWVREGGNLVTLYHRPWDLWDPDSTPPARLEVGQPSLRWRVTDEQAEVTVLAPDHPLLTGPNRIVPEDWTGWHKERGLYFAKSWDEAYRPLLSMADPGEAPHEGSLLSASIGEGRHTHCALILHHQMERLVPGAFRLMANLVDAG
ncbi:PIG-L family deacetylase [Pelagovum pacificum]|uniref:PIG-L family deacetylase n=1 Tax=Pelagovum pacificum TaxID=2588711 RepID=A0A5C5G875_9RHOB|nr:PIG-L family deacetylase [Pelagovum pacificum]QQA41696.1 PIG-L family deacetylase [Pelagovum pacificum]TNY30973.1 PIG-L family deacetylase [Pelagovum pacificum]